MDVLLVEPQYYTKYPPLGLLKLASYHRSHGNNVQLVRGLDQDVCSYPDIIEITSLFTYAWKPVHQAIDHYHKRFPKAKINVGGIYASLMPERIYSHFNYTNIHVGIHDEAEKYLPSYDLLETVDKWKNWKKSIVFTSRGCIRKCPFCVVPKLEGKIRPVIDDISKFIYPGHTEIVLWDNNFLASPNWKKILDQMSDIGIKVDFNQGLDARLIDEEKTSILSDLKISSIRMAYDSVVEKDSVERAVSLFENSGFRKRKILFYSLYNFYNPTDGRGDTPQSFLGIIKDIANLGCVSYPMRYEPHTALIKNRYISPNWNQDQLEMIAEARRVIGFGGAFPPYRGLVDKFTTATDFYDAFKLREVTKKEGCTESDPVIINRQKIAL